MSRRLELGVQSSQTENMGQKEWFCIKGTKKTISVLIKREMSFAHFSLLQSRMKYCEHQNISCSCAAISGGINMALINSISLNRRESPLGGGICPVSPAQQILMRGPLITRHEIKHLHLKQFIGNSFSLSFFNSWINYEDDDNLQQII